MRRSLFAVFTAVMVSVLTTAGASAAPISYLQDVTTVQPGIEVVVWQSEEEGNYCTLGPAVTTAEGEDGFLTAGHCGKPGDKVSYTSNGQEVHLGEISHSVEGRGMELPDISTVTVDNSDAPLDHHVSQYSSQEIGGTLDADMLDRFSIDACKVSSRTGVSCGQFIDTWEDRFVLYREVTQHGDSGAPFFAVGRGENQGYIYYTGVLSGSSPRELTENRISLISDYLLQQGLTLKQ